AGSAPQRRRHRRRAPRGRGSGPRAAAEAGAAAGPEVGARAHADPALRLSLAARRPTMAASAASPVRMPYTPILATLGYVLSPDRRRVLMVHRNARPGDQHLGKYNGLGGKL